MLTSALADECSPHTCKHPLRIHRDDGVDSFLNPLQPVSLFLMNISVWHDQKEESALRGSRFARPSFRILTSAVKNMINMSAPAAWRWQPAADGAASVPNTPPAAVPAL